MKDHAQFADTLALYAMGSLEDRQELAELEAHLGTCGECRRELAALRADMALFAMSATGPQPPQRAKARLMQAVAAETRRNAEKQKTQVVGRLRSRWFTLVPIAAAMILAIASFTLLREVQDLKDRNAELILKVIDAEGKSQQAQEMLAMMRNPKVFQVTLVSAKTPPQPQMKTFYDQEKGHVLLFASNAPQLPDDKDYELWLIPAHGAPIPAGTFHPDSRGSGMITYQFETKGIPPGIFAITIEPKGGGLAPSGAPVMTPAS
jgi:anti-sigma-K factor RskA